MEEAQRLLRSLVPPPRVERVPLQQARGRVLVRAIRSDLDMPPFDKAMMDGYAVRSGDLKRTPVELPVREEIPAGRPPRRKVIPGTCSRIMTGAPMPEGADAVVPVEWTEGSESRVRILRGVRRGGNVAERGEDMACRSLVLDPGVRIRAAEVGILAAVGCTRVPVYRRPTCSLLVTGDELVAPGRRPGAGQIRNSNESALAAQLHSAGLDPRLLGVASDRIPVLRRLVRKGLESDLFLLSGGVSAGKWDHVVPVLRSEGVRPVFHQVQVRPGRPLFVGTSGGKRIFALPGNPVSAFVLFELFVRPFVRRWEGEVWEEDRVRGVLEQGVTGNRERVQCLPARWNGGRVHPLPWGGSADLFTLGKADCLIVVPSGRDLPKGSVVEVLRFS